jgi:hypothetical protein
MEWVDIGETSPSSASTAVGTKFCGLNDSVEGICVVATLTGATGGTLDVYLQTTYDGTTWVDFAHFAQLADGAAAVVKAFACVRGTTQATITTVGINGTPALAANTVLSGMLGKSIRAVYVAGVGTSAGAAQTIRIGRNGR